MKNLETAIKAEDRIDSTEKVRRVWGDFKDAYKRAQEGGAAITEELSVVATEDEIAHIGKIAEGSMDCLSPGMGRSDMYRTARDKVLAGVDNNERWNKLSESLSETRRPDLERIFADLESVVWHGDMHDMDNFVMSDVIGAATDNARLWFGGSHESLQHTDCSFYEDNEAGKGRQLHATKRWDEQKNVWRYSIFVSTTLDTDDELSKTISWEEKDN